MPSAGGSGRSSPTSPGTTRDLVESELVLEGVPLTLLDTAGIRPTDDPIEQLGIARSHQAMATADAVLLLVDLAEGWTTADRDLRAQLPDQVPQLVVGNKADLAGVTPGLLPDADATAIDVAISARHGDRPQGPGDRPAQPLRQQPRSWPGGGAERAATGSGRRRRRQPGPEPGGRPPSSCPTTSGRSICARAAGSLGAITGEEVTEAVLDRVFARFCIGK